jgi:ligand-binding SRPBCC domain-containing protein
VADTYRLETWIWLPLPREAVFHFFADAHNLERITPPFLRFQVQQPAPIVMRQDLRIDYRLRLHGLPLTWQTVITVWQPPLRFVDSQLRGPYSRWVHTHTFEEEDGGTMVRDEVLYALPGPSFVTRIVNRLFVARDVARIFEYRHRALTGILTPGGSPRQGPVTIGPA